MPPHLFWCVCDFVRVHLRYSMTNRRRSPLGSPSLDFGAQILNLRIFQAIVQLSPVQICHPHAFYGTVRQGEFLRRMLVALLFSSSGGF